MEITDMYKPKEHRVDPPTTKAMHDVSIDPEFETLVPPLSQAEYEKLEEDILSSGCIDPIAVWGNIVIDGHHRLRICRKHQIPFSIVRHYFSSRDAAKLWILNWQIARRNMSSFAKVKLVYGLKGILAKDARKRELSGIKQENTGRTLDILATAAGVSYTTLFRAVKVLESGNEELIQSVLDGDISINRGYILATEKELRGGQGASSEPRPIAGYDYPDEDLDDEPDGEEPGEDLDDEPEFHAGIIGEDEPDDAEGPAPEEPASISGGMPDSEDVRIQKFYTSIGRSIKRFLKDSTVYGESNREELKKMLHEYIDSIL